MGTPTSNEDIIIEQSMYEFLNTWPQKPTTISLDELMKREPSIMIQPLSGTKKGRKYVNGSYSATWAFAIYVRTTANDTKHKIDARKTLEDLDKWLSERGTDKKYIHLPDLKNGNKAVKIEMTATPAIAETYDNGTVDYQAVFQLTFQHKEEINNA